MPLATLYLIELRSNLAGNAFTLKSAATIVSPTEVGNGMISKLLFCADSKPPLWP